MDGVEGTWHVYRVLRSQSQLVPLLYSAPYVWHVFSSSLGGWSSFHSGLHSQVVGLVAAGPRACRCTVAFAKDEPQRDLGRNGGSNNWLYVWVSRAACIGICNVPEGVRGRSCTLDLLPCNLRLECRPCCNSVLDRGGCMCDVALDHVTGTHGFHGCCHSSDRCRASFPVRHSTSSHTIRSLLSPSSRRRVPWPLPLGLMS